ncbi:kinase [Candidatus Woesearchaeota archaeon CG_4_10_14_0_2_um_filter_33_13]|nr:MAG: kinase [Candidatus Woesearchaeota archaeon CG_4_10_14_0_2_um_filter_33_13]
MKPKIIAISGTPGTGKSTLTKYLVKKLKYDHFDLHNHYKDVSKRYDRSGKCYDIDIKKFEILVKKKIKETKDGLIIDTHISHKLNSKLIDLCIVLTCSDLKKLEKRLKKRKYSKKKIRENLDSEIFQVCLIEAQENKHKVITFDTSRRLNEKEIIKEIKTLSS